MTTSPPSAGRGLGATASRAAVATIAGQAARIVLQFAGIAILARLLAPTDYGLVAMVTAIIGIGEVFRDFGLFSAAIQAKDLTPGQKNNLFWINAGIGAVLTVLACLAAAPVAALYGDPRLEKLSYVLSITFLLNGISTQFRAHLVRELKLMRLAGCELIGQALALAAAVVLATSGAGFWALAVQQVGQALLTLLALVVLTSWFPGRLHRSVNMRPFLSYGSSVAGAQLLGYASRNVDSLIIGTRFGAAELGIYNRAFQLVSLPLLQLQPTATRVALPVLSRLQDNRERFNEFLRFGHSALVTVVALLFSMFGAQASAVVEIALGRSWLATVPILQILLIAGFFQAATYSVYWTFLTKGLTRSNLIWALVTRPLMIGAIAFGSIWGMYGVATAYTVSVAVLWPMALIWIARAAAVDARGMFWIAVRTLVVFGSATALSYLATVNFGDSHPVVRLVVGWAALLAAVAIWTLIWPAYRADVATLFRARRLLARSRGPKASAGTGEAAEAAEAADVAAAAGVAGAVGVVEAVGDAGAAAPLEPAGAVATFADPARLRNVAGSDTEGEVRAEGGADPNPTPESPMTSRPASRSAGSGADADASHPAAGRSDRVPRADGSTAVPRERS